MNLQDFRALYENDIDMHVDWPALVPIASIEEVSLSIATDVAAIHTAWYTPQVANDDYRDPKKSNLTVGEVAADLTLVPTHRGRIEAIVKSGSRPGILPAYRLGADEYFLLDGNHRAVAAAIAGRMPLKLHVINAPVSESILVDLWRWETPAP